MMMRFRKQATLLLLGALTLLTLGLISASAAPVTFSANTSGSFSVGGNSSGSTLTIGGTTVTFASKPNEVNVALNPGESSNITLGVFNATSGGSNALNAASFTLTITFTLPNDVSGKTVSATLSGTISSGASGAQVNWSTTTLTFNSPSAGTFTLTIEPSTPINSPISPDASRIRGTITYNAAAAIPEPLTLLTLGSGLAGLAALGRRRKKA
ncbi:MAG: PEP-CTERM sorting domain-containing protein [Blastocatellia bacterium]